jgi:arabinose-5-phosphate isomerase
MDTVKLVISQQLHALKLLSENLDPALEKVLKLLVNNKGKVVFMGLGKTGHIASKLAATYSSLGIPSFFVHATEALHGDLGMIEKRDIVILISNSGNSAELNAVLPSLKLIGPTLVAFTSNKESVLVKNSKYHILYPKVKEADHLGLAPTSSSTVALVLGDAIGVSVAKQRKFNEQDFAKFHPGGALGKKLLEKKK